MKGRRRGSGFRRCFAEIQKRLEWRSRRCARCESWDKQDRQQGWWIIVPSVLRCSEENIRIILTEYNMSAECVLRGRLQRYFCQQVWPESTREFPIHSLHRHFVAARISRNSLKLNLNVSIAVCKSTIYYSIWVLDDHRLLSLCDWRRNSHSTMYKAHAGWTKRV